MAEINNSSNDENDEQFDLMPQIDEPMNAFKVVHLYNKSDIYHLTRQVLLDSILTQNTYCFFYHILAKNVDEFNQMYGSFACLIDRSDQIDNCAKIEADLYLNVDSKALSHIVTYIQTSKISGESIYAKNWKTIDEIIDLSIMFGMPNLVSMLRNLHPSEEKINEIINMIKYIVIFLLILYKKNIKDDYDIDNNITIFFDFIEINKKLIIDSYIKTNIYHNDLFMNKFLMPFISMIFYPSIPTQIKQILVDYNILMDHPRHLNNIANLFIKINQEPITTDNINIIKEKINSVLD